MLKIYFDQFYLILILLIVSVSGYTKNIQKCSDIFLNENDVKELKITGKLVFTCKNRTRFLYTSYLKSPNIDKLKYKPENVTDGYTDKAWCVNNKMNGLGEIIIFPVEYDNNSYLDIFPGFGKSIKLFKENNRLRKIRLFTAKTTISEELSNGKSTGNVKYEITKYDDQIIELKDTFGFQSIEIPILSQPKYKTNFKTKEFNSIGIEILETYPGSKYKDTCISELRFPNRSLGKTENLYLPGEGIILIGAHFLKSQLSNINSFWVENIDGKRSGWVSPNSAPILEIKNSDASLQDTNDCGPDCDDSSDYTYTYSISVPAKPGLKFSISSKGATSLHIETNYFGKGETQESYNLLPTLQEDKVDVFHLTDLSKSK